MRWMRRLALFAVLASAAGCMRFAARPVPAPEPSGWRAIGKARVTTTESAHFLLRDVQVTADSVTGWHEVQGRRLIQPPNSQRIALHRSQVRRFEVLRIAPVRTGLLALALAYGGAILLAFRAMGG
jgi:hypothetical protein